MLIAFFTCENSQQNKMSSLISTAVPKMEGEQVWSYFWSTCYESGDPQKRTYFLHHWRHWWVWKHLHRWHIQWKAETSYPKSFCICYRMGRRKWLRVLDCEKFMGNILGRRWILQDKDAQGKSWNWRRLLLGCAIQSSRLREREILLDINKEYKTLFVSNIFVKRNYNKMNI